MRAAWNLRHLEGTNFPKSLIQLSQLLVQFPPPPPFTVRATVSRSSTYWHGLSFDLCQVVPSGGGYASDDEAFSMLIRGKTLADLFADKGLVREIFAAAGEAGASEVFINHQIAVFELNHPGGDMRAAMAALTVTAEAPDGDTPAIQHTKASVLRRLALETRQPLERTRFRAEARQILTRLARRSYTSHPVTTLAQLDLDELGDLLAEATESIEQAGDLDQRALTECIRRTEQTIFLGLQAYPGDEYLLALEAQLSDLLRDHPRALKSLKSAFESNPARAFVAVRLARSMEKSGDRTGAIGVLERCLVANPSSKECHLELARVLMRTGERPAREAIGHHLKRSFTEGDSNYYAQFWWARHEYLYGDRGAALTMFATLSGVKISPASKRRIAGPVHGDDGKVARYVGTVMSVHGSYCFARCSELGADIFVLSRGFSDVDWPRLRAGARLSFGVAFSMRGAQGTNPVLLP